MLTTQKRSDQKHPCLASGGNGCRGFCGGHRPPASPPAQTAPPGHRDAAQHPADIDPPHPILGAKGAAADHLPCAEPNNWAINHLLLVLSWGSPSGERIIPNMMSLDPNATVSWPDPGRTAERRSRSPRLTEGLFSGTERGVPSG